MVLIVIETFFKAFKGQIEIEVHHLTLTTFNENTQKLFSKHIIKELQGGPV